MTWHWDFVANYWLHARAQSRATGYGESQVWKERTRRRTEFTNIALRISKFKLQWAEYIACRTDNRYEIEVLKALTGRRDVGMIDNLLRVAWSQWMERAIQFSMALVGGRIRVIMMVFFYIETVCLLDACHGVNWCRYLWDRDNVMF